MEGGWGPRVTVAPRERVAEGLHHPATDLLRLQRLPVVEMLAPSSPVSAENMMGLLLSHLPEGVTHGHALEGLWRDIEPEMPGDPAELVRRVGDELLVEDQMERGIGRGLLEPAAQIIVPLLRPRWQIAAEEGVGGSVERRAMEPVEGVKIHRDQETATSRGSRTINTRWLKARMKG